MIRLDTKYVNSITRNEIIKKYQSEINKIVDGVKAKTALGSQDRTG
ncbi:MAG: hypothetical protein MJ219_00210 [Mycoplasmoidaceae bacterium]|nr:hypothetical protein [Mycoplasmoidaceae bacterium]